MQLDYPYRLNQKELEKARDEVCTSYLYEAKYNTGV